MSKFSFFRIFFRPDIWPPSSAISEAEKPLRFGVVVLWGSLRSAAHDIAVEPNGDGWRVWAHPKTPDLPITHHQSFHVDAVDAEEALAQAKERIDGLLVL